jgi:penicillin-binding protein 1C
VSWFSLIRTALIARQAVLLAAVLVSPFAAAQTIPSFEQVRSQWQSSQATLLDRHGAVLHRYRVSLNERRFDWLGLSDVSPALQRTLVLSEDQRFYEHSGVDWRAVATAAFESTLNKKTRGASTLTMQLAGLLQADLKVPAGGRNWDQKIRQAVVAQLLESRWTKAQIIEAYLNLVPLRGELVGIDAASRVLFERMASGLDYANSAVLVSLIRAPNANAEQVGQRACQLASKLGSIMACQELVALSKHALARRAQPAELEGDSAMQLGPLARRLVKQAGQAQRSSIDRSIQILAVQALNEQIIKLSHRGVTDGAAVVLDKASGQVLAWVSGAGVYGSAPAVDHVLAQRQAGSTLKPFIYASAIEQKYLTAASLIDDEPLHLDVGSGQYTPQNYDKHFHGQTNVRIALGSSLNIPAIKVLMMVGPDTVLEKLRALGFSGLATGAGFYGPSLALGSPEVSLIELTNAYRALGNQGSYTSWHTSVLKPTVELNQLAPKQMVFSSAASFITTDILADNNARALAFGMQSVLATKSFAAVKTGTSKDMRDNWCVGFTDRYAVGVWVGNSAGAAMHEVSGVSGAAPIWAKIVNSLHASTPSAKPIIPASVVKASIASAKASDSQRHEWFVEGTQSEHRALAMQIEPLSIKMPVAQTIYAIDPDIPPHLQRISFQATGPQADGARWILNGRDVGAGALLRWQPAPGSYQLVLQSGAKQIDTVHFSVRGLRLLPKTKPTSSTNQLTTKTRAH